MASMIQKHQIANFGREEQSIDDGLDSMDEMKQKIATRIGAVP